MKAPYKLLAVLVSVTALNTVYAGQYAQKKIDAYQQQGVSQIDTDQGKQLWYSKTDGRSCTSCHGDNIKHSGKHSKTQKEIKPMAFSVNPERYQDDRKIEKWFLRNCKWTLGRECSIQEKANILSWLSNQ